MTAVVRAANGEWFDAQLRCPCGMPTPACAPFWVAGPLTEDCHKQFWFQISTRAAKCDGPCIAEVGLVSLQARCDAGLRAAHVLPAAGCHCLPMKHCQMLLPLQVTGLSFSWTRAQTQTAALLQTDKWWCQSVTCAATRCEHPPTGSQIQACKGASICWGCLCCCMCTLLPLCPP